MVKAAARIADEFRTPRAAAVSGIAFAVLLAIVLLLLRADVGASTGSSAWYASGSSLNKTAVALRLMPVVGILFLWFIGVIRSLLGAQEDRLFATVFLGSGLLFVAMIFIATAMIGGLVTLLDSGRPGSDDTVVVFVDATAALLIGTLAIKMAAVFTLVVSNLGRRTGLVPRWLVGWGYATSLVLLLAPVQSIWLSILFPAWVFALSSRILVSSLRATDRRALGEDSSNRS